DRADRGRPPLGARARGRRAGRRRDPRLPAHQAAHRGRGRARLGPPPGAEPGTYRRTRDRGGHRLPALPPRRGDRPGPPGGAAAVGPRRAAGRGGGAAGGARPAAALRRSVRRRGRRPRPARQEAGERSRALRAGGGARRGDSGPRRGRRRAPRRRGGAGRVKTRVEIMHGVNLDVLEVRDASVYGGFSLTELEVKVKRFAEELGLEASFSQTNHEGQFCESLHNARDTADGLVLNPGAWTHYSYAIRDAIELTGLPA